MQSEHACEAFPAGQGGAGKVLVTGAGGFVGRALCNHLAAMPEVSVVAQVRRHCEALATGIRQVVLDLSRQSIPAELLADVTHVVHLAAVAHNGRDQAGDANLGMTQQLLASLDGSAVQRLVFVSSIGVLGRGGGSADRPLDESTSVNPQTAYSTSKRDCESAIRARMQGAAADWSIIRPPLVYGPQARGSYGQLVRLVRSGLPLPFARLDNGRTMVGLDNLVDLIALCLWHPQASNQVFHACDRETLSVSELIATLQTLSASGRRRMLPCPPALLRYLARLLGRSEAIDQLLQPLWLSHAKASNLLGWQPPRPVLAGLEDSLKPHCASDSPQ